MAVDDQQHVAYVTEHVRTAETNAKSQPDVAVMFARKAIEAMLRHIYEREVGDPGKHMLEHLITTLRQKKVLPPRAEIHFQTVRAFGNFESHAQSDFEKTRPDAIRPCMIALEEAAKWYFGYAKVPDPAATTPVQTPAERRSLRTIIVGSVVVLGGGVTAAVILGSGNDARPTTTAVAPTSTPPPADAPTVTVRSGFVAHEGSFVMGSTAEQIAAAKAACPKCRDEVFEREAKPHRVTLSRYEIQATEVTVGDFAKWVRASGATIGADEIKLGTETLAARGAIDGAADLPVASVTYAGAAAYCASLGGALPTEAQWEFAARGAAGRDFPWTTADCSTVACDRKARVPVATSPGDVTPESVRDLGGNVAELVRDGFARYACVEPCTDPFVAPDKVTVVRGGMFGAPIVVARAAERGRLERGRASQQIGFRCVLGGKP